MDLTSFSLFAGAYLAVVMLPGPGVAALMARVMARGTDGAPAFIAGFVAAAVLWFALAATGLAALAAAWGPALTLLRYAGAAYLLFLAWKLWRAEGGLPPARDTAAERPWRLFLTGLAINLSNPKAGVFFLALLPAVVRLETLGPAGYLVLGMTVAAIVGGVFSIYALAAARARRLLGSARGRRLAGRGSAAVMAGAAVAVAAR